MLPVDFLALAQQCAPGVHPTTLQALVKTESGFNPYAIGVVGGHLERQPRSQAEAEATARALSAQGWNYSVGLAQVNRANFEVTGLAKVGVFDPCANLRAGAAILSACYARAANRRSVPGRTPQEALRAALSCYYSGNETRGFQLEARNAGSSSYVQRVAANAVAAADPNGTSVVPALRVIPDGGGGSVDRAPVRLRREDESPKASAPMPASISTEHPAWDVLGDF